MAPKKYFFVFCTIFLMLALLLGLGAWLTQVEIEGRTAAEQDAEQDHDPSRESDATPVAPTIRRLADPPPVPDGQAMSVPRGP